MKNLVNKKAGLFVLLLAILCLCAVALGVTTFTQKSVAYAETTELYTAPLAYEYVAATTSDAAYYKVIGVDVEAMKDATGSWKNDWDITQRSNISIEIPAVYNDNTNGEAPVKIISSYAFNKEGSNNPDFNFKALNLRNAVNLEIIEGYAFGKSNIDGELYIPSSIKKLGNRVFYETKIKSIVFGDDIGEMEFGGGAFAGITLDNGEIVIPEFFKPIQISQQSGAKNFFKVNIFHGLNGIRSFSVNKANAMFYAKDGALFAKENDKTYLFSYPSGKEGETYIVPADVTHLVQRLFDKTNLKLIVCPATLQRIDAYAFTHSEVNVFLDLPSELKINPTYSFYLHQGKIIVPNEEIRTAALASGVLNGAVGVEEEKVLYLSDLTDVSSKVEIDTSFDAEAVKSNLNVTAMTNGESPISVPLPNISDFTVTLPEGGLIVGDNTINVAYKGLSKDVVINVEKATPVAPAAPTVSGTPTTDSITLEAIAGAEYSIDGVIWQDSPTFTGLAANTEYTFYARIKATDSAHASPASVVLTIKTAESPSNKGGLSGGAIAGIVIGSVLVVGILALLALFLFRKDKSQGFKEYYAGLCGKCAAAIKGCCGKIKGLFSKNKAENNAVTLPKDSSADQDVAEEPNDDITEEPNDDTTEKPNDDAESKQ